MHVVHLTNFLLFSYITLQYQTIRGSPLAAKPSACLPPPISDGTVPPSCLM